jgi:hypothetical protein
MGVGTQQGHGNMPTSLQTFLSQTGGQGPQAHMGHGGQQPGGNNPGTGFQLLGITNKGAGVPPSPRASGHAPTPHQHILANNLKNQILKMTSKQLLSIIQGNPGQAVPAGLPQTAPAGQGLHGMNNPSHQLLSHGKKWNPPVGGFI